MAGLYADENFPLPVVAELRRLGFDVLTMYEDDKANQSLFLFAKVRGQRLLRSVEFVQLLYQ